MDNVKQPGRADLVLRGGSVLVLDEAARRETAIAITDGRIVAVGGDAEVSSFIDAATRVIELDGRAVLPGINDAHLHGMHYGAVWPDTLFGGGAERIEADHVDTREELVAAALRAGERLSELGITSYTEPGVGPGEDEGESGCCGSLAIDVYQELAVAGKLRQRITMLGLYGTMDGPSSLEVVSAGISEIAERRLGVDARWLNLAGIKVFGDLIPMMRSAWTRHAYDDGSHGGLLVEGEGLEQQAAALGEMVRRGHAAGLQVGVHATGDRTVQAVIDAVRAAGGVHGARSSESLAHYIIHGDMIEPAQLAELAELGMWWNTQPGILTAVEPLIAEVLGTEVARAAWPLLDGIEREIVTLSSDAPVVDPDWRRGVAAAEQRMLQQGAERGAVEDAARLHRLLRAYTAVPARQDRAADWKGTLELGKVADLVMLSGDPFDVGAARLPELDVECTVLDGRVVYERS